MQRADKVTRPASVRGQRRPASAPAQAVQAMLVDHRPEAAAQRALVQLVAQSQRGAALQADAVPRAAPHRTGLPDALKTGIALLSGLALDHVRVHHNSPQPAHLGALACAQGSDIHLAPGQEPQLPHEAWHVVQQAQGRVRPTLQTADGVLVNDDAALEREADLRGAEALAVGRSAAASPPAQLQADRPRGAHAGQAGAAVLQRRLALHTDITTDPLKGIRVSAGGALGVVLIPDVVAKWEADPDEAVATSTSINAVLSGTVDNGWHVGAPVARRASLGEAIEIAVALKDRNVKRPGSVGDPVRVDNMVKQFQQGLDHVVIYAQAGGKDFVNYLADSASKNATAKNQSKRGQAQPRSALAQLADPGCARQLGRLAAVDILMGNRDRLHGAVNFENWMSDAQNRRITLVDNAISTDPFAVWSVHGDVLALAQGHHAALAKTITDALDSLLKDATGYGGGKLVAQDSAVWDVMRPAFEQALAAGLQSGRDLLWTHAGPLLRAIGRDNPKHALLRQRIGFLHFGFWDDAFNDPLDLQLRH